MFRWPTRGNKPDSALDRHYAYIKLIRSNLTQNQTNAEELINICKKDIDLFPDFCEAWMKKYAHTIPIPNYQSFSVLADIYEKQGLFQEAIAICELALDYGLTNSVGEDYASRLERLLQDKTE